VIKPELSVITNIGFDHMQFLGDTLPKIAGEKAGIIKDNIPVVISQRQKETSSVFDNSTKVHHAQIFYAEDYFEVIKNKNSPAGIFQVISGTEDFTIELDLKGNYQQKNLFGILQALKVLRNLGYEITQNHIKKGLIKVIKNTGLKGRWQQLGTNPIVICDTGHNEDGIKCIIDQINEYVYNQLFMVIGMVNDKELSKVLSMLPKDAYYFFVQANIPRAMSANDLYAKGNEAGLIGEVVEDVNLAITEAKKKATKDDLIFIGGSTFVVAEINEL
jgi:dihydrofolate synthase/folylpolyglutamate synthase